MGVLTAAYGPKEWLVMTRNGVGSGKVWESSIFVYKLQKHWWSGGFLLWGLSRATVWYLDCCLNVCD